MLRVGLVTPALYWGGAERCLVNLAREMHGEAEVVGCAMCHSAFTQANMIKEMSRYCPVYPNDPTATPGDYGTPAIREVARNADVLVCWGDTASAISWAEFEGPVAYVVHGCGEWDKASLQKARNAGCVSHWVCVSSASLPLFLASERPTIIGNGVEPERCLTTRPREEVREELGLSKTDFAVGYLGRMAKEKNPVGIALALAYLPPWFKGVWIGGGYHMKEVRREIYAILGERAIFVDTVWDIGNYMQAFDLFALLSPAEGFSMGFLEASLAGIPCLMTPVGVMPYLVERHGQLWYTVPVYNAPLATADVIRKIALDPADASKHAKAAQELVRANYTVSTMARDWAEYLNRITQ